MAKMSDLAAVCAGIGIGLLIVLPVVYVQRREIAENVRRLFRGSEGEAEGRVGKDEGDEGASDDRRPQGLSLRTALFVISVSSLNVIWGLLSGQLIFTLSGVFLWIVVLLAWWAGKAARNT